ncbi:hypothetical protein G7Z17_g4220 [Cylindrodendrum hubeiense]|uniref:GED domain-containing protein n=1 Tax=Cylindrodendrum hubeiense TaxID=595255 RepID=A0A9P5HEC8_9HYPO|nr:hypothetical protein G7Z17_g4220 [Cylindrodendrum hubeiense]
MSHSTEEPVQTPPSTPSRHRRSSSANAYDSGVEGLSSNESSPARGLNKRAKESKAGPKDSSDVLSPEDPAEEESVTKNPFHTERGRILFEAIDELQAFECSKALDIPQVLGATCCTRFPTRITSKRTPRGGRDSYRITIEPAEVTIDGLERAHNTIKEYVSSKYMGIRQGKDANSNNFAAEVLKVELSGPDRPYFSILDLPGHFNSTYDVNKSDQAKIEEMIVKYMQKRENTVICVLDASNDLAHQPILELAHEHIQDRERILGVFTKCDRLLNNLGEANHAVSIATGRGLSTKDPRFMPGGWFLVRNRSDNDADRLELDVAEKMLFRTAPWKVIPTKRLGSAALKIHLGKILDSKIKSSFPAIRANIEKSLGAKLHEKHELGDPRGNHDQRRNYAIKHLRDYEERVRKAINHPGHLKARHLELRQEVTRLNQEFDIFMRARGARWEFQDYDVTPRAKLAELSKPIVEGRSQGNASQRRETPAFSRDFDHCLPMEDSDDLLQRIDEELIGFQANQLPGIINPDIFPAMYQLQVEKWFAIATAHMIRVRRAAAMCSVEILNSVCPPKESTEKLCQGFTDLLEGYFISADTKSDARYSLLCEQETKCKILQTTDPKFKEDIVGWRRVRFQQAGLLGLSGLKVQSERVEVEVLNLCFDLAHPTIQKNMINEVHDVLKVYYKISLETFIRSITSSVEDYISGEDSPVTALRADRIMELSEEQMERLAGEDESTLRRREVLNEEIEELTSALKIVDAATRLTRGLDRD